MVKAYYYTTYDMSQPAKYKHDRTIVDLPYTFYRRDGRVVLDVTDELKKGCPDCIYDLLQIDKLKEMDMPDDIADTMSSFEEFNFVEKLYIFNITSKHLSEIVTLIETCDFYEFKYVDIGGYVINSFSPLYFTDDQITCIAFGDGTFISTMHPENVLEFQMPNGQTKQLDVSLMIMHISTAAINRGI